MKERGWIEPIVERVVGQVLDSQGAQLRTEIVRRSLPQPSPCPLLPRLAPLLQIWLGRSPKSNWVPLKKKFCAPCSIRAPAMPPESHCSLSKATTLPDGKRAALRTATKSRISRSMTMLPR